MTTRRATILGKVEDLITNFAYYDRKEDAELRPDDFNQAVRSGEITVDEIADEFRRQLRLAFQPERRKIGVVELLRERAYALYPDRDDINDPKTVVGLIAPGTYPLYFEPDTGLVYWQATGTPSVWQMGGFAKIGDGMFAMNQGGHVPTGDPDVTVQSGRQTLEEFRAWLATPEGVERLRFHPEGDQP